MKLMSDVELQAHIDRAVSCQIDLHNEIVSSLKDNHDWEVRRLTARADDAERERDRFRAGYKTALNKLRRMRKLNAAMSKRLMEAGVSVGPTDKDGKPSVPPLQKIMDEVSKQRPGMDTMSENAVRTYVERELRNRGADQEAAILDEVLAGDDSLESEDDE